MLGRPSPLTTPVTRPLSTRLFGRQLFGLCLACGSLLGLHPEHGHVSAAKREGSLFAQHTTEPDAEQSALLILMQCTLTLVASSICRAIRADRLAGANWAAEHRTAPTGGAVGRDWKIRAAFPSGSVVLMGKTYPIKGLSAGRQWSLGGNNTQYLLWYIHERPVALPVPIYHLQNRKPVQLQDGYPSRWVSFTFPNLITAMQCMQFVDGSYGYDADAFWYVYTAASAEEAQARARSRMTGRSQRYIQWPLIDGRTTSLFGDRSLDRSQAHDWRTTMPRWLVCALLSLGEGVFNATGDNPFCYPSPNPLYGVGPSGTGCNYVGCALAWVAKHGKEAAKKLPIAQPGALERREHYDTTYLAKVNDGDAPMPI